MLKKSTPIQQNYLTNIEEYEINYLIFNAIENKMINENSNKTLTLRKAGNHDVFVSRQ